MPDSRLPCPCPRCNGALVTQRTVQRHASCVPPTSLLSFSAWSQHLAGITTIQSSGSDDSDVDGVGCSHGSSQDNTEHLRPSKRFRSSAVHLSSSFLISHHTYTISPSPMYALYLHTRMIHTLFFYPSNFRTIQMMPMSAVITNDHQLHFVMTQTPFNPTAPMALRLQVISTLTILTSMSSRMLCYRPNSMPVLWHFEH